MPTKRHLFHILNARSRAAEYQRQEKEADKDLGYWADPRRDYADLRDLTRLYPLIEDENGER